jgi:hypothetical protein
VREPEELTRIEITPVNFYATLLIDLPDGRSIGFHEHTSSHWTSGENGEEDTYQYHIGERVEDASVRELREETTLVAQRADFLLHYDAYQFRHSVFWVRASGTPVPSSEITSLAHYRPGAALNLAPVTRASSLRLSSSGGPIRRALRSTDTLHRSRTRIARTVDQPGTSAWARSRSSTRCRTRRVR